MIGIGIGFYLLTTIAGLVLQNGTITSQSTGSGCPPGTYWMQSADGTGLCAPCTADSLECLTPSSSPIASPRYSTSDFPCLNYTCPEGGILVNEDRCMWSTPVGEYPICEYGDHYYAPEGVCANVYPLVEGVPCIEGYVPILYQNKMLCVKRYSPFNASCPFAYKQQVNEFGEIVCVGFTNAECATPTPSLTSTPSVSSTSTTYLRSSASSTKSPSSTPSVSVSASPHPSGCYEFTCINGVIPSYSSLFSHPICIYSEYDAIANSEGYLICPNGGDLWAKKCYIWSQSIMSPCTFTPSPTSTIREVPSESASSTPSFYMRPSLSASSTLKEVPSESASSTPSTTLRPSLTASSSMKEVPSTSPSMTLRQVPSESASSTPSTTLRPSLSASSTLKEVPSESASSTPSTTLRPSLSASSTLKEVPSTSPSMTLRQVPSESASSTPSFYMRPSLTASSTLKEVPSESASSTPSTTLRPSLTASSTLKEVPSESASSTPSTTLRPSLTASSTLKEVPSTSPSMTLRQVPSESASPTLKEVPSASATTTPKCPEYICPEPSILVRERFCYWNETIPAKARCQEGDIYNQDENEKVCVKFYIPQNGTSGTYICKEGFRFVIHEENPYCIQKYEPNFSNCPEGFRYHIDEKTGAELCSKVTDAICVYSHQTTSSTQTPKPTPRCTDPKNPRCIKPDSILNELAPNAALSPLPSRRPIATLLAIVSRLPLPSPFVKPETTMVASDIPIYIPSRISIPQIDSSLVDKPQKVQEIQATLACTLRLPLEKVRINKIAFVNISTGDRRLALIDPTLYLLDSAGSVECYSFSSSDQTRSLQSAKSSNDEKVEIDYFIVNPPVEIITMNQTEFTEVLRQSPVLKTLVQSIGGDSKDISSAVMFENYAAAAVVGPSPSPLVARDSSSSFNFPAYGIGILGAAGGLVAIIAIMVVLGKRRARSFDAFTSSAPPMPTTANPVFVVTNQQYGHYGRGVAKESFPPTYSSV